MKIILVALLSLVVFVSGCTSQGGECGKFALTKSTNKTISNNLEAFNELKGQLEHGGISYIYSDTRVSTIDKIIYENRTLTNDLTSEMWVLNNDVGVDKDGNMFVRLTCL